MRDCLLRKLKFRAAQVPRMVEAHISVCAAMLKGTPGRTLRRILARFKVLTPAADVFWGWVAQESIQGWLQLTGGRPQPGRGAPLVEWRVQAAEAGGWGGLLSAGDAPWFACYQAVISAVRGLQRTDVVDDRCMAGQLLAPCRSRNGASICFLKSASVIPSNNVESPDPLRINVIL